MSNTPIPIFKVYKDLSPYYDIKVGDFLSATELTSVRNIISDSTQSITVTQEEGRGAAIAIQFEYGLEYSSTPKPSPFPFFQSSGNPNRRVIVSCGYNNIGLTDSVSIPIVALDAKQKLVTGALAVGTTAKFPRPYSIFCGKLERPSINGGRDGKLTITTFGLDSVRAFFKNPGGLIKSPGTENKPKEDYNVISLTQNQIRDILGNGITPITVESSIKEYLKYLMTYFKSKLPSYDQYLEFRVNIDKTQILTATQRSKLISITSWENSTQKDVLTILNTFCKLINCTYRVYFDPEKNIEVLEIIDNRKNSLLGVDFDGVAPGVSYAIVMNYGEAVLEFSWSGTTIGGVSVNPETIRTEGGKIKIGGVDSDGYLVEYSVNTDEIKKYVDSKPGAVSALSDALAWAKENPDEFIATFTTLPVREDAAKQEKKPEFGVNGITLNITMRYPLPGLRPGVLIYFGIAGDFPEEVFPKFLRQVYKVRKVVDTFSAKENIWEQVIECLR